MGVETGKPHRLSPGLGVRIGVCIFAACCTFLCGPDGRAQKATNGTATTAPAWISPPDFSYSPRDRVDPFASFLHSEPKGGEGEDRPERSLTPLEKIAPSQLKLVGILRPAGDGSRLALVELPNGKGYILRPGTTIGQKEGVVTIIQEREVTIEETTTTPWGEEVRHTIVLELQDPAGERHDG
ncbi:pilus assembly protein PilP [Desulfovermiculus halophilus]|uniref:pilus assembly protein PilP n=1 Tax=Desulfovermiculus halophilus TaxID=339722 RepID=UPI000489C3C9|nr:pilus assembly protein PilP [Desulfovermiculus halophilus]